MNAILDLGELEAILDLGELEGCISSILVSTQEVGRNTRLRLVFPPTLLSCSNRFLSAL